MFEGILKAFKKRLETSQQENVFSQSNSTIEPEDSSEPEEFDILKYVETHGVFDKDSKESQKTTHTQQPQRSFKKEKRAPIEVPAEDLFVEDKPQDTFADGVDEILNHVNRFGVYNKDGTSLSSRGTEKGDRSVYKNKRSMEKRIDLHGMTVDEADHYLRRVIDEAKSVGITQLLIIHGRGMHSRSNGGADVLRQRVRQLLSREYSHLIESYKYAPGSEGGDGATRVFLK